MKFSRKTAYALQALADLAACPEQDPVQARELARRTRIPLKFLEHILVLLKGAGLLQSRRGAGGGYALGQAPEEIRLGAVVRAVEGPLLLAECLDEQGGCTCVEGECGLREVMDEISTGFADLLDSYTLADICARTRQLRLRNATAPLYHI